MSKKDKEKKMQNAQTRLNKMTLKLNTAENEFDAANPIQDDENTSEATLQEEFDELSDPAMAEIRAIETALLRIAEGSYGFCTKCSTEIFGRSQKFSSYAPFYTNRI